MEKQEPSRGVYVIRTLALESGLGIVIWMAVLVQLLTGRHEPVPLIRTQPAEAPKYLPAQTDAGRHTRSKRVELKGKCGRGEAEGERVSGQPHR